MEKHEIWDENLQSFVDMTTSAFPWLAATPADGSFDIDQAWHLDYVPYVDFIVKITYESFYSQQAEEDRIKVD